MPHNLTVQVLDSDGEPIEHVRVHIYIDGIFSGGGLDSYTDDTGHAEFTTAGDYEHSRELTITVRNQHFGPYAIGGGSYTVQLE